MSRHKVCALFKALATLDAPTVKDLAQASGFEDTNVREWLYALRAQGVVARGERVARKVLPGRSTRGKQKCGTWEFLL